MRKSEVRLGCVGIAALIVAAGLVDVADARSGGGARISGARPGGQRSLPANYGSLRPAPVTAAAYTPASVQPRAPAAGITANNLDTAIYDTRRGGQVTVANTPGGATVAQGETAAGRDYAYARTRDGDSIVAGRTDSGDLVVRAKGDGVLRTLPDDYETLYYDDDVYYHQGNDYYWPYYYDGEVYYQEIYPPPGVVVTNLPPTAGTLTVGDGAYYLVDGVYYQRTSNGYVVVDSPLRSSAEPAAPAQDGGAVLDRMSAYVGSLTNFAVDCTETIAAPEKGPNPVVIQRRVFISRPNRIAAMALAGDDQRRFWYDGKAVSVYDAGKKAYASIAAPDSMSATFDLLQDDYGLIIPLADLLRPDLATFLHAAAQTISYGGQETVAGSLCDKLLITTAEVKGTLWIDADAQAPRPRMLQLLYITHPGQPRYQVVIERWAAQENLDDTLFVFAPPAGAARIEMVPHGKNEPGS